jgi:glucose-6-phosphate isomerase
MSSLAFEASGAALAAVRRHIDTLVEDRVASRIAAQDNTLWGPEAEA